MNITDYYKLYKPNIEYMKKTILGELRMRVAKTYTIVVNGELLTTTPNSSGKTSLIKCKYIPKSDKDVAHVGFGKIERVQQSSNSDRYSSRKNFEFKESTNDEWVFITNYLMFIRKIQSIFPELTSKNGEVIQIPGALEPRIKIDSSLRIIYVNCYLFDALTNSIYLDKDEPRRLRCNLPESSVDDCTNDVSYVQINEVQYQQIFDLLNSIYLKSYLTIYTKVLCGKISTIRLPEVRQYFIFKKVYVPLFMTSDKLINPFINCPKNCRILESYDLFKACHEVKLPSNPFTDKIYFITHAKLSKVLQFSKPFKFNPQFVLNLFCALLEPNSDRYPTMVNRYIDMDTGKQITESEYSNLESYDKINYKVVTNLALYCSMYFRNTSIGNSSDLYSIVKNSLLYEGVN